MSHGRSSRVSLRFFDLVGQSIVGMAEGVTVDVLAEAVAERDGK